MTPIRQRDDAEEVCLHDQRGTMPACDDLIPELLDGNQRYRREETRK